MSFSDTNEPYEGGILIKSIYNSDFLVWTTLSRIGLRNDSVLNVTKSMMILCQKCSFSRGGHRYLCWFVFKLKLKNKVTELKYRIWSDFSCLVILDNILNVNFWERRWNQQASELLIESMDIWNSKHKSVSRSQNWLTVSGTSANFRHWIAAQRLLFFNGAFTLF